MAIGVLADGEILNVFVDVLVSEGWDEMVLESLIEVMLGVGMYNGINIILVTDLVTALKFTMSVSCIVDIPSDVVFDTLADNSLPGVGVEILDGVKVEEVLGTATIPLKVAAALSEEAMPFP